MDPIVVVLISGTFSMSAAIAASQLLKLPVAERPGWMQGKNGQIGVLMGGNLFALILVASMFYGFFHLTWWLPVLCLFLTFPVIHVLILEKLLGPTKEFTLSGLLAVASIPSLWLFW